MGKTIYQGIYALVCMAYRIFRPILVAAIDDPEKEWDDFLMGLMDKLFNYEPGA